MTSIEIATSTFGLVTMRLFVVLTLTPIFSDLLGRIGRGVDNGGMVQAEND